MQTKDWIDSIIKNSQEIDFESNEEKRLAEYLIEISYFYKEKNNESDIGIILASSFDLFVAAHYYSFLLHKGWLYCPNDEDPRLFFPYTNCCPRHVLSGSFYFHPSNKPKSGNIGTVTSRSLLLFFKTLFKYHGLKEEIYKGVEPVDAIIINKFNKKVFFAEIKASPLTIPPISSKTQNMFEEKDGDVISINHKEVDFTNLFNSQLEIMVPRSEDKNNWFPSYFPIGLRKNKMDTYWAYRELYNLLSKEKGFFPNYFNFWYNAFLSYHPKNPISIFWLTNASGAPKPIPSDWKKRRNGKGFESISDSKTSVGMDRTDDIKKGIYQVLKLGSEGKPISSLWDFKVGILSNIHAARHFDEYLSSLQDIVWTLDPSRKAKKVKDLPSEQLVYNLFDGIITFTKIISRDNWIDSFTSFIG